MGWCCWLRDLSQPWGAESGCFGFGGRTGTISSSSESLCRYEANTAAEEEDDEDEGEVLEHVDEGNEEEDDDAQPEPVKEVVEEPVKPVQETKVKKTVPKKK